MSNYKQRCFQAPDDIESKVATLGHIVFRRNFDEAALEEDHLIRCNILMEQNQASNKRVCLVNSYKQSRR